jgi:hypothetical protein
LLTTALAGPVRAHPRTPPGATIPPTRRVWYATGHSGIDVGGAHMLRSKWIRVLTVLSSVGLAVSLPAASTAARPDPPSLKMLSVLKHATVVRYGTNAQLYVYSAGIYLAAVGGPFEIDAARQSDGSIALWQVSRDLHGVHPIRQILTPQPVRFGRGLPQFLHLDIKNAHGVTVTHQDMPYCLDSGFGEARVDTSGPDQPTFPYECGGTRTKGAVWGIDRGWADGLSFGFRLKAPDGRYTLTVSISPAYAKQLGIPADAASATIALTVKTQHVQTCGVAVLCRPGVGARPALRGTGAQEGPAATGQPSSADPTGLRQADGVPDMRALPAHSLSISHNKKTGRDYLNFGATIWNAGSGPLVVEGFRTGSPEVMQATQFIYQDGHPARSQVVGQFEFDHRKGHHHWHMENIAQYDLLDRAGNRVVLSDKQSFCLAPTDAIDLTLPGVDWQPDQTGLWSACEGEDAIWLREVLPAGWGDTYYQFVAGQSFNITSLPNGHYQVRVTTDPNHNLLETDYDNNVGLLPIKLGGAPGHRTVQVG